MQTFKLGLDLDGVICNNHPFWNVYFNAMKDIHNHGQIALASTGWDYYKDICKICYGKVLHDNDVVSNFLPYDGAPTMVKYLENVFQDSLEINFITARPKDVMQTSCDWVKKWFNSKDGRCHVIQGKKGLFAFENNYDLVIDDSPGQILDFKEHGIPVLIRDHASNKDIDGPRVSSISEMQEYLLKEISLELIIKTRDKENKELEIVY